MRKQTLKNWIGIRLLAVALSLCLCWGCFACAQKQGGMSASSGSSTSLEEETPPEVDLQATLYQSLREGLQTPAPVEGSVQLTTRKGDKTNTFSARNLSATAKVDGSRLTVYGRGDIAAKLAAMDGDFLDTSGAFALRLEEGNHGAWFYDEDFEKYRLNEDVSFYVVKPLVEELDGALRALQKAAAWTGNPSDFSSLLTLFSGGWKENAQIQEKAGGGYRLTLIDGEYSAAIQATLSRLAQGKDKPLKDFLEEYGVDALSAYDGAAALLSGDITLGDGARILEHYLARRGYALSCEQMIRGIFGEESYAEQQNRILDELLLERFGQSYTLFVDATRSKLVALLEKPLAELAEEYRLPQSLFALAVSGFSLRIAAEFSEEYLLQGVELSLHAAWETEGDGRVLDAELALRSFGEVLQAPSEDAYFAEPSFDCIARQGGFADEQIVYTYDKGDAENMSASRALKLTYSGEFTYGGQTHTIFSRLVSLTEAQAQALLATGERTLTVRMAAFHAIVLEDVRAYLLANDGANAEVYLAADQAFFRQGFRYTDKPRGITLSVGFAYGEQALTEEKTLNLRV